MLKKIKDLNNSILIKYFLIKYFMNIHKGHYYKNIEISISILLEKILLYLFYSFTCVVLLYMYV